MAGSVAERVRAAVAHYGAGRFADAAAECQAALAADPGNLDLLNVLGLSESHVGAHAAAEATLRRALDTAPEDPRRRAVLTNSLGYVALRRGALDEAEAALRAALALAPTDADANFNLGCVLHATVPDAAERHYRTALESRPNHLGALNNLGGLRLQGDDLAGATRLYETAVELAPGDVLSLRNLAKAARHAGDVARAIDLFDRAAAAAPKDVDVQFGRALTLLLAGDYTRGWEAYRWRYQVADNPLRHADIPEWQGEDPAGKTVLVHTEQGFGDAIQFARFAPRLAALGAKVILECPKTLARLFATLDGIRILLVRNHPPPPVDLQVPLIELARHFEARVDDLPAAPYLKPPKDGPSVPRSDRAGSPKVGVVLGTRSRTPGSDRKSLPLDAIRGLLGRRDVDFYSLHLDATDEEKAAMRAAGAVDLTPLMGDFADSAALVRQLDLVVSVDTAAAHLAGALGRPVWVLLHAYPDWRWMVGRSDSPWYPSARLFRQPAPGDWTGVLNEVGAALDGLAR